MENIFTFHKTVRGYNHIRKDTPCEDYSCSYLSLSSYEEKCPEEKEEVQTNEIIREQMQSEFISDEEAELWGFPEEKVNSVEGERAYYIAVVADGHGDSDCVRSQIGSQFIVEVVTECMKGFADGYYEDPFMFKSNVCGRKYHLRHITAVSYTHLTLPTICSV